MKIIWFVLVLCSFLACMSGGRDVQRLPQQQASAASRSSKDQSKSVDWTESHMARMTLREKISQMFIIWMSNRYMPSDGERWKELERYARDVKVGGFYFSTGGIYEFPVHANTLQKIASVPLLMTVDFEWGAGMRIHQATTFPKAMALSATRDTTLAYRMGNIIAKEARALGVHQNYAPVVDVNNNPNNPVINTRSFGEHPQLVSNFARAFIHGTQDGNVVSTVKHFPGHGDTDIDTHLDLPSMKFSRARFDSVELVPFQDAIRSGVMSVMVAHIHAEAFDEADILPATASDNVVSKLLKEELHFSGLIVTDAMAMKGISKIFSAGDAAVRAVKAGVDVLLMSPNADDAIDSLVAAVGRGEVSEGRIDSSVRKILNYKQWCGLDTNRFVDISAVAHIVGTNEHQKVANEIARKSITVLGNESRILPFINIKEKKILDIVFSDTEDPDGSRVLHDELVARKPMELLRIDPRSNMMEYDEVLTKAKSADLIICQFMYHTRSSEMSGFLHKKNVELMKNISQLNKPTIVVSTGNPYIIMEIPPPSAYVVTYGQSTPSVDAAAEVIFGEQPARGKLPITIPGRYAFGEGVEYNATQIRYGSPEEAGVDGEKLLMVDDIVEQAIADSAFPGAVLLAAKDGIIVHEKAYGKFTYEAYAPNVSTDAIFDLASVTKVIATTSAVMKLTEEKKISLDDPIVKYFPQFGQYGKEKITIYNLLVHNSGLPAWRKFYEFCDTPQCVLDSIFATPLVYATGDSTVYSDLGLITVGKIVEKVTGVTLAAYVDSLFFKPLGMTNTMFTPPPSEWKRVVPTEVDSFWKKTNTAVRGRVHDENAATLGGISGHAGLFSTASDLVKILQMELSGGIYNGRRYLDSTTIARFTSRQSARSSRGIGWDTRTTGRSFSGKYTSSQSFLHTGFTGTSVVVDPEKKVIIVFLTNRVYPTRSVLKILRVRPMVHDAIFGALK